MQPASTDDAMFQFPQGGDLTRLQNADPLNIGKQVNELGAEVQKEFGRTTQYMHLALLCGIAFTQTNILSVVAIIAFTFYATRPPVGHNAKKPAKWTPGATYWLVVLCCCLMAIAGVLIHIFYVKPNKMFEGESSLDQFVHFCLGHRSAPDNLPAALSALIAPGLLLIFSVGVIALGGETKQQLSEAYHETARSALDVIKERGWISEATREEAADFTTLGFALSHVGYIFLVITGFVNPSVLTYPLAVAACYAMLVHAIFPNPDKVRFWNYSFFWLVIQVYSGAVMYASFVPQFLPIFGVSPDDYAHSFKYMGLEIMLPFEASKWKFYVFFCSNFFLFTCCSHHGLFRKYVLDTRGSGDGYGTFAGSADSEDGDIMAQAKRFQTMLAAHAHEMCALAMLVWSFWHQSLLSLVLLIGALASWLLSANGFRRIGPFVLMYCLAFLLSQAFYNIPTMPDRFDADTTTMAFLGLHLGDVPFATIIGQVILATWIAINVQASRQAGTQQANMNTLTSIGETESAGNGLLQDARVPSAEEVTSDSMVKARLLAGFIFSNAYVVTLGAAYIYSVSQMNIINTVYLFLSVFFFCFPKLASGGWIVFVIFSELIVILLYCWQFVPAENALPDWLAKESGLELYEVPWRGPGRIGIWTTPQVLSTEKTWQHVMGVPVFITLFSLLQLSIFQEVREGLKDQASTGGVMTPPALEAALARELPGVSDFLNKMRLLCEEFAGTFAFLALLVIITLQPPNAINFGYLIFVFLLCFIYSPAGHGRRNIFRLVWTLLLFYTVLVLLTQYVMEFPRWKAGGAERDFWKWTGFVRIMHSRVTLFVPTTFSLLLSLYYVKILDDEGTAHVQASPITPRLSDEVPWVQMTGNLFKRWAILHSGKVFLIVMVIGAIVHPNAFGLVLLLYVSVDLCLLKRGGLPRFPIMLLSACYLAAEYLYQISKNGHYGPLKAQASDPMVAKWATWAGFARWADATYGIQSCIWICIWGALTKAAAMFWVRELPNSARPEVPIQGEPCLLFLRDKEAVGVLTQKFRDHFNHFFSKHGILLTLTMLTIAAVVRYTVMSFFYLLVASSVLVFSHDTLSRCALFWTLVAFLIAIFVMLEYTAVWNPFNLPFDGVHHSLVHPKHMSIDMQYFWCFKVEDRWTLFADFMACLFAALQAKNAWLPIKPLSPLEYNAMDHEDGDLVDRMVVGAIRIFVCSYAPTGIIMVIALVGGTQVSIGNFIYLLVPMMFLSYGFMITDPRTRSNWWGFLRLYNLVLLGGHVYCETPFGPEDRGDISGLDNTGIFKNPATHIVIFFLLALQSDIFGWEQFEKAIGYQAIVKQEGRWRELDRIDRDQKTLSKRVLKWLKDRTNRQATLQMLQASRADGSTLLGSAFLDDGSLKETDDPEAAKKKVDEDEDEDIVQPVRAGVVMMRSSWLGRACGDAWGEKFLALEKEQLLLYRDAADTILLRDSKAFKLDPHQIFDLADIKSIAKSAKVRVASRSDTAEYGDSKHCFKIVTKDNGKMWFTTESAEEMEAWLYDLQLYTAAAKGERELPQPKEEEVLPPPPKAQKTWCQVQREKIYAVLPENMLMCAEYLETCDEYYNPDDTLAALQHMSLQDRLEKIKENARLEEIRRDPHKQLNRACVAEHAELPDEDAGFSNVLLRLIVAMQAAFMSYTGILVYALLVINHASNGGITTMILPGLGFVYFLGNKHRPAQWWWHLIVTYTLLFVAAQYMVKLPAFCRVPYFYAVHGNCDVLVEAESQYMSMPFMVGVRTGASAFLEESWLDLLILLSVGIHIARLQSTGRWSGTQLAMEDVPRDSMGKPLPLQRTRASSRGSDLHDSDELMADEELPPGVSLEDYKVAKYALKSKDHYTYMFFADLLALVWTVLTYQTWYPSGSKDLLTAQINDRNDHVDMTYLFMLLCQFLVIIADRVAYLNAWNYFKVALHLLQVVGYNAALLLVFQMQSGVWSVGVFYVFKCIYFGFSALQIRDGYPVYTQGEFLTRVPEGVEPSAWQYYAYQIYRATPFLFEMRALLDWTCSRTALDFYQWFKLEDIHGQLFQTLCAWALRRKQHKYAGEQQSCWKKVAVGGFTFLLLTVLLWLPLLLFSNGSALMVANPVKTASMHISLSYGLRSFPLYEVSTGDTRQAVAKDLQLYHRDKTLIFDHLGTQVIDFPSNSDSVFTAPPPLANDMVYWLSNPNSTMWLDVETTYHRQLPLNNKVVSHKTRLPLDTIKKIEIATVLDTVMSSKRSVQASFTLNNVVPDILELPAEKSPQQAGMVTHDLLMTYHRQLHRGQWDSWWEIEFVLPDSPPQIMSVLAVSPKVMGGLMGLGGAVSQLGIVGFYVAIAFVIGRLLRAFVSNLGAQVVFEDMESVAAPMYLCKNIYLARQEAGTALDKQDMETSNALVLEELLYWELIRLYRQPEKLYKYTTNHNALPMQVQQSEEEEGGMVTIEIAGHDGGKLGIRLETYTGHVVVAEVEEGSLADGAIQVGDVMVELEGVAMCGKDDTAVTAELEAYQQTRKIEFMFWRGKELPIMSNGQYNYRPKMPKRTKTRIRTAQVAPA